MALFFVLYLKVLKIQAMNHFTHFKKSCFLTPFLLLLIAFAVPAFSTEEDKNKTAVVIELDKKHLSFRELFVRIQVDFDEVISQTNRLESYPGVEVLRQNIRKDGKIDVDIIIKTEFFVYDPITHQNANGPVRISLFDVEVITVDNISGVQSSQGGNEHINARIIEIKPLDQASEKPGDANAKPITQESINELAEEANAPKPRNAREMLSQQYILYPNPVLGGNISLKGFSDDEHVSSIKIFNALGVFVKNIPVQFVNNGTVQASVNDLPSGIYFLRMHTAKGEIVKRFNIQQ